MAHMRISPGKFAAPAVAAFVCLLASPIPAQQSQGAAVDEVIHAGHITSELGPNAIVEAVTREAVDAAVRSTVYAKRTLDAGFTSIRNLGADGGADRSASTAARTSSRQ
jgi:hypothetical protein